MRLADRSRLTALGVSRAAQTTLNQLIHHLFRHKTLFAVKGTPVEKLGFCSFGQLTRATYGGDAEPLKWEVGKHVRELLAKTGLEKHRVAFQGNREGANRYWIPAELFARAFKALEKRVRRAASELFGSPDLPGVAPAGNNIYTYSGASGWRFLYQAEALA